MRAKADGRKAYGEIAEEGAVAETLLLVLR